MLGLLLGGLLVWQRPGARASELEIEDPEIEKGEIELEYRGGWFTGRPAAPAVAGEEDEEEEEGPAAGEIENEVVRQVHEMELEVGFTDRLQFQVGAEFEQERNEAGTAFDSLKLSEVEVAVLLEFVSLERFGFIGTLFTGYEQGMVSGEDVSGFVIGPLVKAGSGPLSATGNFYFTRSFDVREREVEGGMVEETVTPDYWTFSYAAQLRYMAGGWFGFGAEAYGEMPDIGAEVANTMLGRDPRTHQLGPTLYLSLGSGGDEGGEAEGPNLDTTLGLLFGLTEDTADLTLKWDAELEF